ncbi:MAG: PaaI family thioesterase [Acidobacteria bacterium]|nr:PaaI family thioesterase [Acidobacteriota bacterium]
MELSKDRIAEIERMYQKDNFPYKLGMRLTKVARGEAEMRIELEENHTHMYGFAHGGVIATLIDTVAAFAIYPELPEGAQLASISLTVNFLIPGERGTMLIARANPLRVGRRIAVGEVAVFNETGFLIAKGTVNYKIIRDKGERDA